MRTEPTVGEFRSKHIRALAIASRTGIDKRYMVATAVLWTLMVLVATSAQAQTREHSGSMASMLYEGFTEPLHDIQVAAAEIGRLETIDVKVGQRVQSGQVLGKLEDSLQQAAVKIATLQSSLVGELEAAKAEVKLNQSRTDKLRKLAQDRLARPDELTRAETELQISLARQLAAEEQLKMRVAELERYKLQLERRKIRSPMTGVISKIYHQPGEYITPGDPAIIRLLVMDRLYAVFNVPVEDVVGVQPGTDARIYLRSSGVTIDAKVSTVAPDIDGESGTVQIRVELDNAKGTLLAGDRCTLQLMRTHPMSQRSASNGLTPLPHVQGADRR